MKSVEGYCVYISSRVFYCYTTTKSAWCLNTTNNLTGRERGSSRAIMLGDTLPSDGQVPSCETPQIVGSPSCGAKSDLLIMWICDTDFFLTSPMLDLLMIDFDNDSLPLDVCS